VKIPWPGINEKQTVIIPLGKNSFDVSDHPIIFQGTQFLPKDELHVTLVGKRIGKLLQEQIDQNPEIETQLKQVFQNIDWSFKQTGPIHILARAKEKMSNDGIAVPVIQKSIIQQLTMPGMPIFYDYLKAQGFIESDWPIPPPHVTLYTRNCPHGIGVSNLDELDEFSKGILSIKELRKL
jgi:hypothetical protein